MITEIFVVLPEGDVIVQVWGQKLIGVWGGEHQSIRNLDPKQSLGNCEGQEQVDGADGYALRNCKKRD